MGALEHRRRSPILGVDFTLAAPVIHIPSSRPLAVSQLPYVVETTDIDLELPTLRLDTDVQDLRDQHHADLVVMVGVFPFTCGLA